MALGLVNAPGSSTAESALETANEAKDTADRALTAANNAQSAADAALDAAAQLTYIINAVPTQNGTLTYTGSEQSPEWNSYNSEKLTVGGTVSGTGAGTYTATFTPADGYKWSDGTTEAKSASWTIGRAVAAVPSQSGSLTYTGSAQSPSWSNYDSGTLTLGGTTSGTNAGTYTATFTPTDNYQWSGGSTDAKSVNWTIGKAAGSLSLSKTSVTLSTSALTAAVTATRSGSGSISASSSNTSAATVSVSGTTITITAKSKGSATITVSVAADSNYNAASKTVSVTVNLPSSTLNDCTPAEIQGAAQAGIAASLWNVGDKIGIALSGTVGELSLNGTYYAFIIGFDHNSSVEGSNTIHFQFGKNSSGTDIAFCDSNLNNKGGSGSRADSGFVMNTTATNSGGWKSSYMRNTICPAFLSAMPSAWQSVIASCTKYTDNVGGGSDSDTASNVTATSDKIWLLSPREINSGNTEYNSAEKNLQGTYSYYQSGNSRLKNKHTAVTTACYWWFRSPDDATDSCFIAMTNSSSSSAGGRQDANNSFGFAPGFMVA